MFHAISFLVQTFILYSWWYCYPVLHYLLSVISINGQGVLCTGHILYNLSQWIPVAMVTTAMLVFSMAGCYMLSWIDARIMQKKSVNVT